MNNQELEILIGLIFIIVIIILSFIFRGGPGKKASSLVLQWLFENGFEDIENKKMFFSTFGTFLGKNLSGSKIRIFKRSSYYHSFNNHLVKDGSFVFQYITPKSAPFTMRIVPKLLFRPNFGPFSNDDFTFEFENLRIYTQDSEKVKEFINQDDVIKTLSSIRGIIQNISITGKQLSVEMVIIEARSNLLLGLDALNILIQSLDNLIDEEAKFENLHCYNCYSVFDFHSDTCSVCHEPSPRCVICWSDPDSFDAVA